MISRGAGWSKRVVDPGTSEGNADAAHGMRSHKGSWTPQGRDDFAAATRVLLLVLHGGLRNRVWVRNSATTGIDAARDETWRGFAF